MNAPRKIPISHNLYRGHRLTNPLDLLEVAKDGQSVVIWHANNNYTIQSASFVLGMQFRQVANFVSRGMIYFTHQ
jgi:hypothetical protein